MKVWDKFKYTGISKLWPYTEIHTVVNLISDNEWELIIAEDWLDYWYEKKIKN